MKDNLKFKVIFGFAVASLALFAALYITITNFYQLKDSIEELTLPDEKVQKLNKIIEEISETERIVRLYTLTNRKEFLDDFDDYTTEIQAELDSLKLQTNQNSQQYKIIDSIEFLWRSRTALFNEFIDLKSQQKNINLASEAINKIASEALDTAKIKTTTTTKKIEVSNRQTVPAPVEQVQPVNEISDNRGIIGLFNRIFAPKKEVTTIEKVEGDTLNTITETYVTYDTVISEADAAEIWETVMKILADYQKKENALQMNQSLSEVRLLEDETQIMDKIKHMIKDLQIIEIARAQEQSYVSKTIAQKSIFTIVIIGLGGMFVSVIFISLILNDITKSNYYKSRLEASKKRAEKLAKAKEEFLANMSHEIRTPLSAILGFTEQLMASNIQEKHRIYLQAVKNSSDHLLSTVNDILDFSKIEADQLTLEEVPFRISDHIREVCETLNLKANEKNIELKYSTHEDLDYVVVGDPFRLKQILINLVGNAIKFTEKGSVEIIGSKIIKDTKSIWVKISVKDTGIGISKDKIKSIFRDFSQADTTITRKYGGTGLGLAITKKLIMLHQGKIYVHSEPNKGSVFNIELKYKLGDEKSILDKSQEEVVSAKFDNKLVLVVDDDEYNLLLFHTILKKWGMKTDMASNGREGIELIGQKKYDLILSDIHMPEKSGLELVEEIRKAGPNKSTPILAITANVMKEDVDQYLEAGFDDIVLKPFREKELYHKIINVWKLDPQLAKETVHKVVEESENEQSNDHAIYDLFDIERFTDGDAKAMVTILRGLIDNNRSNIFQMHEYCATRKWTELGKVAHKMMPSFNHLKAYSVVSALRKIEEVANKRQERNQIPPLVEHVKATSKEIFAALEEDIIFYEKQEQILRAEEAKS
jgi:signal transduction histidine kinase/CheY-like chemotaxis protein